MRPPYSSSLTSTSATCNAFSYSPIRLSWITRSAAFADLGAGFSYRQELQIARQRLSAGQALSAEQAPSSNVSAPQEATAKRASRAIGQARFSTFEILLIKSVLA
jgi:hypothetical protein